jgi:hypothetical protein
MTSYINIGIEDELHDKIEQQYGNILLEKYFVDKIEGTY